MVSKFNLSIALVREGHVKEAEKLQREALASQIRLQGPEHPNTLEMQTYLAETLIKEKRYAEAVVLLQQRYQAIPQAGNLFEVAGALQLAGRNTEAEKAFAEFETKALLESTKQQNSNRELIFYYADHANQTGKALQIAQRECAWRHDVYTLDAYAWALHVSGQDTEARKQMETALAVGIRDAKLFRHAGEIALAMGDPAAAESYLKQSAELNAPDSKRAQLELASINAGKAK